MEPDFDLRPGGEDPAPLELPIEMARSVSWSTVSGRVRGMRLVQRVRRGLIISVAVGALAAATGCAGKSAAPGRTAGGGGLAVATPSSVAVSPSMTASRGLSYPVDPYRATTAELQLVANAKAQLIDSCMARFGFHEDSGPIRVPATDESSRYGVSETNAAQYGYHSPPDPAGTGKGHGGHTFSAEEVLVLTGARLPRPGQTPPAGQTYQGKAIPAGGCKGEAERRLSTTGERDLTADGIGLGMYRKAQSDPRVVAVLKSWSACMKRSGYDYADTFAPVESYSKENGPASQAEIRTAVTDVACQKSTNVIGVWYAVEVAYEKEAVQMQLQQLTEAKHREDAAAQKAAQVLGVPVPATS